MGWSCRHEAGQVLDAWQAYCIASTGMSNVFVSRGKRYFYETSSREHNDGAITGTIRRECGENSRNSGFYSLSAGTFRIEGNGKVSRAPAVLKNAAKHLQPNDPGVMFQIF